MFYKAFNADMTSYGGYPFEVGDVCDEPSDNTWSWFHYADKLSTALGFYPRRDVRFCVVEPLGRKCRFTSSNGTYFTTNRLRIVREIGSVGLFRLLIAEDCPLWRMECLLPKKYLRYLHEPATVV